MSSLSVRVRVDDGLSPVVRQVLDQIGPGGRRGLFNVAGRASLNALRKYHREYNSAGRWSRRGGGPSEYGESIVRGWGMARVSDTGVVLTNAAPHFRHKITGGTITPKRVKFLTIPLIPEARNRFAETYQRVMGKRLFIPHGTNVLAEKDGKGFRAVYALVKSVTHKPWPNAMPGESVYADPFVRSILDQLRRALG